MNSRKWLYFTYHVSPDACDSSVLSLYSIMWNIPALISSCQVVLSVIWWNFILPVFFMIIPHFGIIIERLATFKCIVCDFCHPSSPQTDNGRLQLSRGCRSCQSSGKISPYIRSKYFTVMIFSNISQHHQNQGARKCPPFPPACC